MKKTKRKTAIKCPYCKITIIGYKYPTEEVGYSSLVKYNENTSRRPISFNNSIFVYCLKCESEIRKIKKINK